MTKRIYNLTSIAEKNEVSRQHVRDLFLRGDLPANDYVDEKNRPYWETIPDAKMKRGPGKHKKDYDNVSTKRK